LESNEANQLLFLAPIMSCLCHKDNVYLEVRTV
jgi:hypothetical protein